MEASLTFVGTATTLLRLGPFTVLTDPNFLRRGQRAYLGKGLWSRRLTDPALRVEELPPLTAVVLSHLHGDHWDRVAERGLDRAVPVLSTPQAADRLRRKGFATRGLEPWERAEVPAAAGSSASLTVEALPAVHARGVMGRLLPPVMGSLLTYRDGPDVLRVYVSGDTLTGGHLDEIAARHPHLDVAVVHLGGTRVLAHTVTLDGDGGAELVRRLRPRSTVPVHHADYGVFRSPLADFERAVLAAGVSAGVRPVAPGETVPLHMSNKDPLDRNGSRSGTSE